MIMLVANCICRLDLSLADEVANLPSSSGLPAARSFMSHEKGRSMAKGPEQASQKHF